MKALFLGDVVATPTTEKGFLEENITELFGDTLTIFEGNDINMVNLECALTDCENPIQKIGPALKSPPQTAKALAKIGINYCSLSNNHSFDFGITGYRDTQSALESAGILYTGFGEDEEDARRNLIIEKDGERICIIAVCEREYTYALPDRMGARLFDEFDTLEDIRNAKKIADRIIVLYHGGKEHCHYPSPRVRKLCHAMAKSGADLILCQHSHCIGCYEIQYGCHILYGQGNYHFIRNYFPAESSFAMWNTSLAVCYDTKENKVHFTPLIANESCTGLRMPSNQEAPEILGAFNARNEELKSEKWLDGWRAFCQSVSEGYRKCAYREFVTEKEKEIFAHYLDCQAHTDVWRELFPTKNASNEKKS